MTETLSFLLGIAFAVCAYNTYLALRQAKLERDLRNLLDQEPPLRPEHLTLVRKEPEA